MGGSNRQLVFYFLCSFYYFFLHIQNCDGGIIFVYTQIDFKGSRSSIDSSQCSNLAPEMVRKVKAVHTRDFCARLFDGENCSGSFVEILPRSPSHNRLGAWNFSGMAVSVGPCRDPCSTKVTGDDFDGDLKIDLFTQRNFTGFTKKIKVEGCTVVPSEFINQNISVKTYGHCIQLYNNSDCRTKGQGADSIELREGTPCHDDISLWGFPLTKSISHCRYKCPKTSSPRYTSPNGKQKLTEDPDDSMSSSEIVIFILIGAVPGFILLALYIKKRYYSSYPSPLIRFYGNDY